MPIGLFQVLTGHLMQRRVALFVIVRYVAVCCSLLQPVAVCCNTHTHLVQRRVAPKFPIHASSHKHT